MHLVPAGVILYIFSPNAEVPIRNDTNFLFENISNDAEENGTIISGKVSSSTSMKSSIKKRLLQ